MFEIHDDVEVLKRMGLAFGLESGRCSPEQLKIAKTLVPKALQPYVTGQRRHLCVRERERENECVTARECVCVCADLHECLSVVVEMAQGAINQLIGELSHVAT